MRLSYYAARVLFSVIVTSKDTSHCSPASNRCGFYMYIFFYLSLLFFLILLLLNNNGDNYICFY
jgi:hypothetical protein